MYLSGVCSHCKDASLGVFLSHWVKAANLSTSNLSFCFYLLFWRCFLCTEETWSHQNWRNNCHKICCQMPIVWILLICILKTYITLQPFHCTKMSLFHVFFFSVLWVKLIAFCVEKSVLRQVASAVLKRWRFPSFLSTPCYHESAWTHFVCFLLIFCFLFFCMPFHAMYWFRNGSKLWLSE